MISVEDLRKWADVHAMGRSASYPRGWISGKDLQMLSVQVEQNEPLNFYYSTQSNMSEEVYNKYTDTAGNLHWTGTKSGEHTIRAEEGEI